MMVQAEMIKGRIAEAIVRCMFEDLGFEVIPYGYEHTCPTIAKKDRLIRGDVKNQIRKAPDFIIVDSEGNANFVEVKYRKDGVYRKEADYPYRDCYIILLTDQYIGIEQYKNLDDETILSGQNFNVIKVNGHPVSSFKSVDMMPFVKPSKESKEIILAYRDILIQYMKSSSKD